MSDTVSQVASALRLNCNQHRRILNVIVRMHHTMMTSVDCNLMHEFCASSVAIFTGSSQEQAVTDHHKRGLSYTKTTLLINRQCLQDGRPTVTRSAVRTCEFNMVREVNLIEKRPQGNKDAGSNWAKARHRFVVQMLARLGAEPDLHC